MISREQCFCGLSAWGQVISPGPQTVAEGQTLVAVRGGTLRLRALSHIGHHATLVSVTLRCRWQTPSSSTLATPLAHLHTHTHNINL